MKKGKIPSLEKIKAAIEKLSKDLELRNIMSKIAKKIKVDPEYK